MLIGGNRFICHLLFIISIDIKLQLSTAAPYAPVRFCSLLSTGIDLSSGISKNDKLRSLTLIAGELEKADSPSTAEKCFLLDFLS